MPVARLEGEGKTFWPVRADFGTHFQSGELHCMIVAKNGEPRVNAPPQVDTVRFRLPFGVRTPGKTTITSEDAPERFLRQHLLTSHLEFALDKNLLPPAARPLARDSAVKQARSIEGQLQQLFQSFAKRGLYTEAYDAVTAYVSAATPSTKKALQLLEDAVEYAKTLEAIERDELTKRIRSFADERYAPPVDASATVDANVATMEDKDVPENEESSSAEEEGEEGSDGETTPGGLPTLSAALGTSAPEPDCGPPPLSRPRLVY
jgi:hypothetical protein